MKRSADIKLDKVPTASKPTSRCSSIWSHRPSPRGLGGFSTFARYPVLGSKFINEQAKLVNWLKLYGDGQDSILLRFRDGDPSPSNDDDNTFSRNERQHHDSIDPV